MKNPDYHPDRAHLPSPEDMRRWYNGGHERDEEANRRLLSVGARIDRARALRNPTEYESTTQPGVFYSAATNEADGKTFCVVARSAGAPTAQAWDDVFANFTDADEIAQKFAKGEL